MAFKDHFKIHPIINTERLTLRPFTGDDFNDYHKWYDEEIRSSSGGLHHFEDYESFVGFFEGKAVQKFKSKEYIIWCITLKETNKSIGKLQMCNFDHSSKSNEPFMAQVHYSLSKVYQGNGYMTEAVNAVVEWGFNTLGLHKIFTTVGEGNIKSVNVLKRCHFQTEVVYKSHLSGGEVIVNHSDYGRLR